MHCAKVLLILNSILGLRIKVVPTLYSGMPSEGIDDGDSGEERSYTEYKRAKNPRANDPDEAGPRDPAERFDGVGEGGGG